MEERTPKSSRVCGGRPPTCVSPTALRWARDAARAALSDGDAPVEGVLLYSQRSAMIFAALYEALPSHDAPRPTAYCLSEPIAEAMRAAGFTATAPPQADGAALMAMLAV